MVGLEIKYSEFIQAVFTDPTSEERALARNILRERGMTLRILLDAIDFLNGASRLVVDELEMVLDLMDRESPGVEATILASLRSAFDNELVIVFDWKPLKASCNVKTTVAGGVMFLTVGAPSLDEALQEAMSGGSHLALVVR
jgi:hypothetical protein